MQTLRFKLYCFLQLVLSCQHVYDVSFGINHCWHDCFYKKNSDFRDYHGYIYSLGLLHNRNILENQKTYFFQYAWVFYISYPQKLFTSKFCFSKEIHLLIYKCLKLILILKRSAISFKFVCNQIGIRNSGKPIFQSSATILNFYSSFNYCKA